MQEFPIKKFLFNIVYFYTFELLYRRKFLGEKVNFANDAGYEKHVNSLIFKQIYD